MDVENVLPVRALQDENYARLLDATITEEEEEEEATKTAKRLHGSLAGKEGRRRQKGERERESFSETELELGKKHFEGETRGSGRTAQAS